MGDPAAVSTIRTSTRAQGAESLNESEVLGLSHVGQVAAPEAAGTTRKPCGAAIITLIQRPLPEMTCASV